MENEVENFQFKPQITEKYNKELYQKLIEQSKKKNQDAVDDFDDDFLRQELEKEKRQKQEKAE